MSIVESFSKVKVLVFGDIMLDRYWWGSVTRISPEAPVPIVHLKETSLAMGGAANVAANVSGLGAEAYLVGAVGADSEALELAGLLQKLHISTDFLVKIPDRPTTLKTRVVAHSQHVVRIDQENAEYLSTADEARIWEKIQPCIDKVSAVIVSDYAKGMVTENLLLRLIMYCETKNIPLLVDPKGRDFLKYKNSYVLTPNRKEAFQALGLNENEKSLDWVGEQLLADLNLKALLITLGEEGIAVFEKGKKTLRLKSLARHVYDVTGAGDTVIAALATAFGAGLSLLNAAEIANAAAGFVVEEVGTTAININKIKNYLENYS